MGLTPAWVVAVHRPTQAAAEQLVPATAAAVPPPIYQDDPATGFVQSTNVPRLVDSAAIGRRECSLTAGLVPKGNVSLPYLNRQCIRHFICFRLYESEFRINSDVESTRRDGENGPSRTWAFAAWSACSSSATRCSRSAMLGRKRTQLLRANARNS